MERSKRIIKYILALLIPLLASICLLQSPITAYADTSIAEILQSNSNGKAINGKEIDSTSTAGNLFWAASADRTGILFYIMKGTGEVYGNKQLLIMDDTRYYNRVSTMSNFKQYLKGRVGTQILERNLKVLKTPDGYSTRPVEYSDGWHATGNVNSLLTSTTKMNGDEVPYWLKYAYMIAGDDLDKIMQEIMKDDSHWVIVAEPVSIQYIYSNSKCSEAQAGTDALGHTRVKGDPLPAGTGKGKNFQPYIFCGTAYNLEHEQTYSSHFVDGKANSSSGGTYTYKFLNMALPWSMCLERDQEVGRYGGGAEWSTDTWSAPTGDGERLDGSSIASVGYATALYFIDVSVLKPPIHTFNDKDTPGPPEVPDPKKFTNGECVIKKLYYTEELNADGTIKTEAKDYHHYEQKSTTNYISVDGEEGYELVGWKSSSSDMSLTQKSHFDAIPAVMSGTSPEVIKIQTHPTSSDTYLYVLTNQFYLLEHII